MDNEGFVRPAGCESGACVEVKVHRATGVRTVRASLVPDVKIYFTKEEWATFLVAARAGQYD